MFFDKKCKVIFISHGSTIYTEQNRLYEFDDYPPISEKGRTEIEKISNWLKLSNSNIDMIYTSSELRAIQSTRIISKVFKKDFDIQDNFHERRPGVWGGLTFEQIESKYPEMFAQYHKDPASYWAEDGENTAIFQARIKQELDKIVKENFQKRIIIVTHPGVIQAAVAAAMNIPAQYQARVYIPSGSATQINYYSAWPSLIYSGYLPGL